jgi:hypothetical protein
MTVAYALVIFSCGMAVVVLLENEYSYRVLSHNRILRFIVVCVTALTVAVCLLSIAMTSAFSAMALRTLVLLTLATPLAHFVTSRFVKEIR